jgi:ribosomal protein S18 acetylase RimI-like enzyme
MNYTRLDVNKFLVSSTTMHGQSTATKMVENYANEGNLDVKVEVYPWNESAKRFYESQGFSFDSLVYLK